MREHRRAALCAKDTDIKQRQTRPLHQAGLRLRRRKRPLHLPGRQAPDEGTCTIRPPWRHRPLPPSDRLLHLSAQAQLYAGQAKADQALETRTGPRRDASQARSDARCHGRAPADRRAPVRHHQGLDGRDPLLDPHPEAGQNRNEPPRPGLQHQAGDRDHWCRTVAASDPGLSAWISSQTPPQSDREVRPAVLYKCVFPRPRWKPEVRRTSRYSITSSATSSMVAGTVRPSALAVLRLMISEYLVGY